MNTQRVCLALLITLLAASAADAQQDKKKLYRWVDKQGKVHYDDALPPEAIDQARQEYNAKTGTATGSVDRALTAEERAAAVQQEDAAAVAAEAAKRQQMMEESMLVNYQTEADLHRAYDERISLLKQTIASTDISLKDVRNSLTTLLTEASEAELGGRPVDARRAGLIRERHVEMLKQQTFMSNRMGELASLDAEFQRVLARFRELRGAQQAPTPGTAPATPPATPGGATP
ncbi:DUF4124 domain-containing protein [Arenimonas oryziterrae]|uniref:DUF4124 domain-containing protein n=1 Tax=Arenimonas oryziterrae DSM 21050 = YC6267 TaxID=1121015 RepID=A0A091AXJ2_9GAMM|nr:DUF4124 domain-containing protein [Arenimonas oryziterrae]KFN43982.1 hypothetical protein N789_08515 [Arenimonas oryziterrae DSM 21050 = YC6267]